MKWSRSSDALTLSDAEEEKRLMFGLIFSLKEFLRKMAPTASSVQSQSLKIFKTDTYTCHHMETASGLRFILTSDNNAADLHDVLQHLYSNLYVELVTKNPVYDARSTKPITCKLFRSSVRQYIESLPAFK
ncbi:trafficking protein particle complex subunit [Thraustotheca clavata]|uniref:Trafficking protein particle complex subunit n=1 Tax=Thraustotheca clavata TaxID=74557 RepID=A0A1V9YMM8_9STRA|nr:trafficking protein particle complex subunit [Thraustotheca clavata]